VKKIKMGGGPEASAVGIGCMRFSGMSGKEVSEVIHVALDNGIDLFDHADIYGGGKSEALFGQVFANEPGLRQRMFIQTKCGIRKGFYDLSKEHIIEALEKSLARLNTDYCDMLLLHRPDTLMEPEEIGEAFESLAASGKVRHFGVSNMNPAQVALIQSACSHKLLVNQLQFGPASTAIIDTGINVNVKHKPGTERDGSLLEHHRLNKITIQAWSPLQYGFFAGTFLGNPQYAKLNEVLGRIAEGHGVTTATAAIAWILRHPAGMQAILGTTKAKHVEDISRACDFEMSREDWYEVYKAAGNELP
jgi:predicted oxidoreductase